MTDTDSPPDQPDPPNQPNQPDQVSAGPDQAGDPLEQRQAEEAALAVGFALATGAEVSTGRDGAGTPVLDVPAAAWVEAARHARDVLGMDFFDWLSAVDQPDGDPPGLDVVLHVAATSSTGVQGDRARYQRRDFGPPSVRRILLRTRVADAALVLASLTAIWPGVAWHERETFEMFGLDFAGFDDGTGLPLRPLLLPEGFEGTPLRKSFVLAARAAKAWPGAKDPADSSTRHPDARPAADATPGSGRPGGGRVAKAPARRKIQPPGVPDESWGPREPAQPEAASRPAAAATAAPATNPRGMAARKELGPA